MRTALLVEDEFLIRELAAGDLRDCGFAVTEAGTGEEALAILGSDQRFDVLLTDVRLPGSVDGVEVASEAKRLDPELRVIYTTGFEDESIPRSERECRLGKPYSKKDILAALRQMGLETEE